ncbi:hypothetical protein [Nostoc sp. MG11]|uniref:hypothetical protein n=1 Tax=Nostoc sp. MG11 TaxID=2721166 RepID=UPI001868632D|nr:hypothetical protein [Nostoc sp. MG11]
MNTLLPLSPPQNALEALLKLRDYYAPLVKEYERLYTQSKDSLTHVEALLSNWSSSLEVAYEKSTAAEEENSLLFLSDNSDNEPEEPNPLELLQLDDFKSEESNTVMSPEPSESPIFPLLDTSTQERSSLTLPKASLHGVEIPMLPQYQSLSRPEAIEQVLAEEIGTSVHIDFIVRSLYRELEPDVFKVVKSRVQSSLTQGKESNKWFSVPGQPGYFTLSLSLLSSVSKKSSSPQAKSKNKKPVKPPQPKEISMLKVYEGQFLIDALSTFLEQNAGKVFGISEVITGIYGELNAADAREVKNKVLNELSRGHRTGRFSRVPDQIGFYTWDSKLILDISQPFV